MAWVNCPECGDDMEGGSFGDDAYCTRCDQWYGTDWDYTDTIEGCMAAWTLGKITEPVRPTEEG